MKKINVEKKYFIFVLIVLSLCVMGIVFSFTYAYLHGKTSLSLESSNPYTKIQFLYNNGITDYEISSINGSVNNDGSQVSLSITVVGGNTFNLSASSLESLNLIIKVKNIGNIRGVLSGLLVDISTEDENNVSSEELKLVCPSEYTIDFNCFYSTASGNDKFLNANEETQILTQIVVGEDLINLSGQNFTIKFSGDITQEGYTGN